MKNENSFFEGVFKKIDIKMLKKAKKIVKDSVWVTPVFIS